MFVRSFVCLFVRSFVCLFVCLFVCSFVCLFVCSFVCLFVRSLVRSRHHRQLRRPQRHRHRRRRRRRHPPPSSSSSYPIAPSPLRHRHQPSPAADLSITFATPVNGRLLRSPPAPRSLSRGVSRKESLARSLSQGVLRGVSREESERGVSRKERNMFCPPTVPRGSVTCDGDRDGCICSNQNVRYTDMKTAALGLWEGLSHSALLRSLIVWDLSHSACCI